MSDDDITRFPEAACLQCGKRLNALGALQGKAKPKPGSLIVCIRCGAVMMAADDLTPRGMSEAEMAGVVADRSMMDLLARVVRRVRFVQGSKN